MDEDYLREVGEALWPTRPARGDGRPADEDCNEGGEQGETV